MLSPPRKSKFRQQHQRARSWAGRFRDPITRLRILYAATDSLQIFTLNTPYGRYEVQGREMLKVRMRELAAVATLERIDKSQTYIDAAAKAVKKPVDLAVGFVSNPVGSVQQSMSGVGALFSRIGLASLMQAMVAII